MSFAEMNAEMALEKRGYTVERKRNNYRVIARHEDGTTVYGGSAEECLDTIRQDYAKQRGRSK